MHNVKIISLKAPFTHEFNGVLGVSCMSYITSLIFGWSNLASKNALGPVQMEGGSSFEQHLYSKTGQDSLFVWCEQFYFFVLFSLREVRIDLVRTSTILHVRLVPKIQPAPCYIPKIQISCSQNWRLHNPRLAI